MKMHVFAVVCYQPCGDHWTAVLGLHQLKAEQELVFIGCLSSDAGILLKQQRHSDSYVLTKLKMQVVKPVLIIISRVEKCGERSQTGGRLHE